MMESLQLNAYDYRLPEHLIARYPNDKRDQSRMLVIDRQKKCLSHHSFSDLPHFLNADDLVVLNNTKVLSSRLYGHREGYTGQVEVLLLRPTEEDPFIWHALMKPTRKLQPGTKILLPHSPAEIEIIALSTGTGGLVRIHDNGLGSVMAVMAQAGELPIPPYFKRRAEARDTERYQTVYASIPGSQAAPTAGLHFSQEILAQLRAQQVSIEEITLSVSTGTFRMVAHEDITQHIMDPEHYNLPASLVTAIQKTRATRGRVLAVGTTSVKTLETVARDQNGNIQQPADGWSDLFIYPGFQFQVTDCMLTNFHLPKSTLLMLVSAFMGHELMHEAYQTAITEQYRFYSYGDCMLIL